MAWLSSVAMKYFFNLPGFRFKVATDSGNLKKSGYFGAELPATLLRNGWLLCSGICNNLTNCTFNANFEMTR